MRVYKVNKILGGIDIVLPHRKVRAYLATIVSEKSNISIEEALKHIDKVGQDYYEGKYRVLIEKRFAKYVKEELKSWILYEKSLGKEKEM